MKYCAGMLSAKCFLTGCTDHAVDFPAELFMQPENVNLHVLMLPLMMLTF